MKSKVEKAYSEILKVLKKNKDICVFDVDDLEMKSKLHLFGLQLKEEYGLNIDPTHVRSLEYNKFGDDRVVGLYGEKYRRTISWSDDGTQPEDELLFHISYPTGPYIFGGDYPTAFFEKFFLELKSYKPKYIDSANKGLYFSMDNAAKIFNDYYDILNKYNEENKKDIKKRKIRKMKEELEKLEA